MIAELNDTLQKPKLARALASVGKSVDEINADYLTLAEIVEPAGIPTTARDQHDDAVLACAISGKVDAIVTGDKDLLVIGNYEKILILDATRFLELLQQPT